MVKKRRWKGAGKRRRRFYHKIVSKSDAHSQICVPFFVSTSLRKVNEIMAQRDFKKSAT